MLISATVIGLGCSSGTELTVTEPSPTEAESTTDAMFYGGQVRAADGVAVLVPAFVADDSGKTVLEGAMLMPSSTAFIARSGHDIDTIALDQLPLGDQVPDLRAVATDGESVQLLVGRCQPTANAEYGICDVSAAQTWWVYRVGADGVVETVGDRPALEGWISVAAPNADGSGFVALQADATASSLRAVNIDGATARVDELGAVDTSFLDDSHHCVDGSGTIFGYSGSEGDVINLEAQRVGGEVVTTSIPWDDGWFQDLGCDDEGAWVLTSFGALYSLDSDLDATQTLEVSPFDRTQGVRVEVVRGADDQPTAIVASPSVDADRSEFMAADVDTATWGPAGGLADALRGVKPRFALSFDMETLVPFGVTAANGSLYTVGSR